MCSGGAWDELRIRRSEARILLGALAQVLSPLLNHHDGHVAAFDGDRPVAYSLRPKHLLARQHLLHHLSGLDSLEDGERMVQELHAPLPVARTASG